MDLLKPLKGARDELRQVCKENEEINTMPAITQEQQAAKHAAVIAARERRTGKKRKWCPGDEPIIGIPSDAPSQGLYHALLEKGASPDDAQMYVLNSHIGDNAEWNKEFLVR